MNILYFSIIFLAILAIFSVFCLQLNKRKKSPAFDEAYYDMHTHILPGVDHGAADFETAIAMIQKEVEEGIRHIVLTPHYFSEKNQKEKILLQYEKLCEEVKKRKFPVTLYMGNEVIGKKKNLEDLEKECVCTIGDTSYVLVEFNTDDSFQYIKNAVRQIQLNGYRPIVAHIERYEALWDENAVFDLVQMGALMQVNAGSFSKKNLHRYLITLAKEDLIHIVASDCHDLSVRVPGIRRGTAILEKKLSRNQYEKICFKNPEHILRNEYL